MRSVLGWVVTGGGAARWGVRGAIMAACAVLVGLVVVPSASAVTVGRDTILRNWATGVCLDSNENGDAYAIGCNGGNYQNWFTPGTGITIYSEDGNHPVIGLRNDQTDRCLDSNSGGSVYTLPCNDGDNQYWMWFGDEYNGTYEDYATQLCLTANGNALYTAPCDNDGYEQWRQGY
jgi:serine/threonine-protein kinase